LVRRSLRDPPAFTADVVFAPHAPTLVTVVQVAGSRWTMERSFAEAQGEVGLEHYEVRRWTGWYRHSTLAMWAYALLTV
jgi:SRSO17 transposase